MSVFVDRSKSYKSKDAKTRKKIKKVKSSEQSKTSRHGYSHTNWWRKMLVAVQWDICGPMLWDVFWYLWRKMLVALQMTSPWVQAYKILQAKRVPLQWEKNKSWACPYSKMCKTWGDFDDFSQKPAFCLVGAHITQVQNNKSQPKRPQPFPRAYFGLLSRHLFSSMKIKVFTQPNAFRR